MGTMEEGNQHVELLRKVLVKNKKLERTEVAELLDCDLEEEGEAEVLDELLEFLKKESKIMHYLAFRSLSKTRVTRTADDDLPQPQKSKKNHVIELCRELGAGGPWHR